MKWTKLVESFTDDRFTFLRTLLSECRTKAEAIKVLKGFIGGLSKPSKMPGYSYSIPAQECKTGSRLAKIEGTVCHDCYALKNRYLYGNVKNALYTRFRSLYGRYWVEAMVLSIAIQSKTEYFRWHDAGDIQSKKHRDNIFEVARLLPDMKFWLPTKEPSYFKDVDIPENLTVRVSNFRVNSDSQTDFFHERGLKASLVGDDSYIDNLDKDYSICPAPKQGNKCLDCRACWDDVRPIVYHKH